MLLSDVCLSDVCLSVCRVHWGLSREQRGLERPKLAQRQPTSHVTRIPLSRSKGQRSRSPGRLLSAALTHKAAAAVSVGTYSAWESTAALHLLGGARGAWALTGEERGGGILCRHAHSLFQAARSISQYMNKYTEQRKTIKTRESKNDKK